MNTRGSRPSGREIFIYLIVFLLGSFYVFYVYKSEAKKQQNIILQLSQSIESNLPYSELDHLEQEPADLAKRSFSSLNDALQRTIKSTPSARFAYVYTERNGKLYFLADSEEKSSQAYSPAGQEYTEASTEYYC